MKNIRLILISYNIIVKRLSGSNEKKADRTIKEMINTKSLTS